MPTTEKFYRPRGDFTQDATAKFPSLHADIKNALSGDLIYPAPWYNHSGSDDTTITEYSTQVRGRFDCRNPSCSKSGWGSGKIAIVIRRFAGNRYDAVVFKQRCKVCKQMGELRLDENAYVERVVYRLRKWAGVATERPEYKGGHSGPEHEYELCEGCKRGYCQRR